MKGKEMKEESFKGCLLGLAAGDAVGTAVEFKPPNSFPPVTGMEGGGVFGLKPGEWTDDTSMALCIAESICELGTYDALDQMRRFLKWYHKGHLSVKGYCFDIGIATRKALLTFEKSGNPYSGSDDPHSAGNGSLMRLAPVPMLFASRPGEGIEKAGDSSKTTHAAPNCIDACRYFAGLIIGALRGDSKEELLRRFYRPDGRDWETEELTKEIADVATGSFLWREPPTIKGSGYVVKSMEAALWAFHKSRNFKDGCLLAANLGDDADTTCAIYGQIAGAYYGIEGIPEEWLNVLAMRELIESFASKIFLLAAR